MCGPSQVPRDQDAQILEVVHSLHRGAVDAYVVVGPLLCPAEVYQHLFGLADIQLEFVAFAVRRQHNR